MNIVESAVTITRRAVPRCSAPHVLELQARLLGDHRAAAERREVAEVLDAPVAEARRPHGDGLDRAVLVVGHQHPERAAVDLLGEHDERPRVAAMTRSSTGRRSFGCESGLLVMRMCGSSKTVSMRSGSRTM